MCTVRPKRKQTKDAWIVPVLTTILFNYLMMGSQWEPFLVIFITVIAVETLDVTILGNRKDGVVNVLHKWFIEKACRIGQAISVLTVAHACLALPRRIECSLKRFPWVIPVSTCSGLLFALPYSKAPYALKEIPMVDSCVHVWPLKACPACTARWPKVF